MATQLFLTWTGGDLGLSSDYDTLMLTSREPLGHAGTIQTNTVAGPTAGVQCNGFTNPGTGLVSFWYRVNAVTISGAITKNMWMNESNMSANVGAQTIIDRCDGIGAFISTVENSEKGTELIVTTLTAENWATGTVTSTTFANGDYIRVRVLGNDVGTMASGFTFGFDYGAASAGGAGDSYVTFTETITAYTPAAAGVPYTRPMTSLLAQ
jgi:hypothetical protein